MNSQDMWQPELPFELWPIRQNALKMNEMRKMEARIHEVNFWHLVNIDPTGGQSCVARQGSKSQSSIPKQTHF